MERLSSPNDEDTPLYPQGFKAYLSSIPEVPEKERTRRKKHLIVVGDFPRAYELRLLLDKLGYPSVSSGHLIKKSISSPDSNTLGALLAWPRNAFNQFGQEIFLYNALRKGHFSGGLERVFLEISNQKNNSSQNLKISNHLRLFNGGQIYGTDQTLVYPDIFPIKECINHLQSLGKETIPFTIPRISDFKKYISSKKFTADQEAALKGFFRYLNEKRSAWSDIDVFIMPVKSLRGDQLLVDEVYAEIYPDIIKKASRNHQVQLIDSVEGGNCAINLCQLPGNPGPILLPGPNPKTAGLLEEKIVGKGNVYQFPVSWCSDIGRKWALHCRTNQVSFQ